MAFTVSAQQYTLTQTPTSITAGITGDATITRAGYAEIITFQTVITKTSGTVAGTATLQGSIDGTNWITVPGTTVYTITDVATQSAGWVVSPSSFATYRIRFVNTTGVFAPVSQAIVRNPKR